MYATHNKQNENPIYIKTRIRTAICVVLYYIHTVTFWYDSILLITDYLQHGYRICKIHIHVYLYIYNTHAYTKFNTLLISYYDSTYTACTVILRERYIPVTGVRKSILCVV
jgi:hypothetical protein